MICPVARHDRDGDPRPDFGCVRPGDYGADLSAAAMNQPADNKGGAVWNVRVKTTDGEWYDDSDSLTYHDAMKATADLRLRDDVQWAYAWKWGNPVLEADVA